MKEALQEFWFVSFDGLYPIDYWWMLLLVCVLLGYALAMVCVEAYATGERQFWMNY